jgi:hypothetical protein
MKSERCFSGKPTDADSGMTFSIREKSHSNALQENGKKFQISMIEECMNER